MIVVLDTNVLVSGIFFSGPPAQILEAWREGSIQLALSPEILEEYFKTANVLTKRFPNIEINSILKLIATYSNVIQAPLLPSQVCQDTDDDKFLACALTSESRIIVSGDKHLLKLSGYQGLAILTPREFVEKYLKKTL